MDKNTDIRRDSGAGLVFCARCRSDTMTVAEATIYGSILINVLPAFALGNGLYKPFQKTLLNTVFLFT